MGVEDRRLQLLAVGAAEAAGVRELQADVEIVGAVRAEARRVRGDQRLAQAHEIGQRVLVDDELVGVGAAIVAHGGRLPAEDQLGAAEPEPLPAPERQLGGMAVERAIPALHRQDAEAVAEREAARQRVGLRQRRVRPGLHLLVKGQLDPQLGHVLPEGGRGLQHGDTTIGHGLSPRVLILCCAALRRRPAAPVRWNQRATVGTTPSTARLSEWGSQRGLSSASSAFSPWRMATVRSVATFTFAMPSDDGTLQILIGRA